MNGIRTILWAVVCNTLVTLFMFRLLAHIFFSCVSLRLLYERPAPLGTTTFSPDVSLFTEARPSGTVRSARLTYVGPEYRPFVELPRKRLSVQ